VLLHYDDSALRIDVADTGRGLAPGAESPGAGHGIIGMRERATSVGGTLHAGPGPVGGYRVEAVLPVPAESEAAETSSAGTSSAETSSVETGSRS
jgi:signal transduction histidine kinase